MRFIIIINILLFFENTFEEEKAKQFNAALMNIVIPSN